MQPLDGSVTVTEYGPGPVTVLLTVVTPPPQLKVAPVVVEEAVSVSVVVVQVKVTGAAMAELGGVVFWVTVTDAVLVHPFDGSVTVTVYVEGTEMVLAVVVIPPPQLKVVPVVPDVAVNVSLVVAQVKTTGGVIPALGAVMFCATVAEAVLVQPFVVLVTVTV